MANTLDTVSDAVVMQALLTRDSSAIDDEFIDNIITSVRPFAFATMDGWETLSLPSVTEVGHFAFYKAAVSNEFNLDFQHMTYIGTGAFAKFEGFSSGALTIGASEICELAFYGVTDITSVTFTAQSITYNYDSSHGLTNTSSYFIRIWPYEFYDEVKSLERSSCFCYSSITTATFSAATTVPAYFFSYAQSLTSVSGNYITTVNSYAFRNCTALTSFNFPELLTVNGNAFAGCSSMTGALSHNKLETISSGGFQSCSSLTSVNLPSLTSLGESSFRGCSAIVTATLGELVRIGEYAFYECSALTTVTISGTSLRYIGQYAFYKTALATLNFNYSNVISIGSSAFANCPLTNLTLSFPSCTTLGSYVFEYTNPYKYQLNGVTRIESGSNAVFQNCNAVQIEMNNLTYIGGSYIFSGCRLMTSISLPSLVEIHNVGTFESAQVLTSISLPNLETINTGQSMSSNSRSGTFASCAALKSIYLPKLKTWINDIPFYHVDSLSVLQTPLLEAIPNNFFYNSYNSAPPLISTTTFGFPKVQSIGENAFYYAGRSNAHIARIDFPACTTVKYGAFRTSTYIDKILFGGDTVELGEKCLQIPHEFSFSMPNLIRMPSFLPYGTWTAPTQKNDIFNSNLDASKIHIYVPGDMVTEFEADPFWGLFDIHDADYF